MAGLGLMAPHQPPHIREATLSDLEAIAGLLGELGYPTDAAAVARRLKGLEPVSDLVLVAEVQGIVCGVVMLSVRQQLHRDAHIGRITSMVVSEERRGQGIGRALMRAIEAAAAERGCESVELTTRVERHDAHRFYEQLGYENITGRSRRYLLPLDSRPPVDS